VPEFRQSLRGTSLILAIPLSSELASSGGVELRKVLVDRVTLVMSGALAVALLGSGCTLTMRPVAFAGTPADWEALAGDWRGDYRTNAYDRHGAIAFKLVASTRQASGEVLMMSDRYGWPYVGIPPGPGMPPSSEPRTDLLTVRFVQANRGMISGTMDAYWDPDRRCRASALFLGSVDADVIKGTFTSMCEDQFRRSTGRWKVERKRQPLER